jgi:hypothetical protein
MHVKLMISGGLVYAGDLGHPMVLDSQKLGATDAERLEQLVAAAHFFELPARDPGSVPPLDTRSYDLTIENAGQTRSVRLIDPVEEPTLHALIEFVKQRTGAPS